VATWDDVRRLALALPHTDEKLSDDTPSWRVRDKAFVWVRPLRKRDIAELGDRAPTGEIMGARTEHEGAKFALIEEQPEIYFTTSHFNGYAAVLVRLDLISVEELQELIVDAWLARAPKRDADAYLESAPQWPPPTDP